MPKGIYLSVVVPIRNEEGCIRQTLEMLVRQDYPNERYELLVVDGRSTDATRDIVRQFIQDHPDQHVYLLDNPGRLSSCGRNIGVRAARGELIGVIDGHVYIPDDQLFAAMERLKVEHGALCLARPAPLWMPSLDRGMPFWIAAARGSRLGHSRRSYIYSNHEGWCDPISSAFAYDRRAFDQAGYFDEAFDAAEDVEFHYRLKQQGIEAYTSPRLTIYSFPRTTLRGLFRQMVRYGTGRARLLRKHPRAFTKETLVPVGVLLLGMTLPLALALAWWAPVVSMAHLAIFALYWAILCAAGLAVARQKKRVLSGLLVAVAVWVIHCGLGWGFLKTLCARRDS